jgi:replicative DNA helicase
MPSVAERTLPHNLEAERSVLGAILLHNDAFNLAAEMIDSGDAIDLVTLKEELGRSGEIDEVGGPAYIAALVDGVPRSTNVEHYARIVKEKATLRNLIFSANKILATAYEGEEEADVILDQAEHAIFAIADDKVRDGFVSLRELAQSSLETIEKLHAKKELITGVPPVSRSGR